MFHGTAFARDASQQWITSRGFIRRTLHPPCIWRVSKRLGDVDSDVWHNFVADDRVSGEGSPSVFDAIRGPSREELGDLAPHVSADSLLLDQEGVFLFGPVALVERGTELIEPSFAALLAAAAGHVLCDDAPIGEAMDVHILSEE
jgi:hypothetical protein